MKSRKLDGYQIMDIAIKAGAIMLENGAETYRVEDTIHHILKLYPHSESSSFVVATGIIVTLYEKEKQPLTVVKRIRRRNVNLNSHMFLISQKYLILSLLIIFEH